KGKLALITGASGSIGYGIARCFAEEGTNLALGDLRHAELQKLKKELEKYSVEIECFPLDVKQEDSCEKLVSSVTEKFGEIDILVNNAGVLGSSDLALGKPLADITGSDWDETFQVNTRGIFFLCKSVIESMIPSKLGRIINIASRAAFDGREYIPHYSSSKAAVVIFSQSLAKELASSGITVNTVCPGLVWSDMWKKLSPLYKTKIPELEKMSSREVFNYFVKQTPLNLEQTPEDIGRVVTFLASDDARTITGQSILVDSGSVMR
ncbi:MAG: SDR family oxidoreductase, partial [Nitrospinota bacterium]|nr:SDR family oxidoreductase [Nitrospinota bacterium]